MYKMKSNLSKRLWTYLVICILTLSSSFFFLPENVKAELAMVVSEPYIFVPNGKGAELLIDNEENLYLLHIINGEIFLRKYNSFHVLKIVDKPLYLDGTNEFVDAVWDDSGYIHLTWTTSFFGAKSVMYAKIDKKGNFIVPPIKLSGDNTDWDHTSAIDVNSLGQAYVAWDHWWIPGLWWAEDVLYAKIDSDGSIIFTQQYVAPENWDTDFHGKKDFVVDSDDNLHVIFDRVYLNSHDIHIYYKKFRSDGIAVLVSEKQLIPTTYYYWSSSMEAVLDSKNRINIGYSIAVPGGKIETFYTRIDLEGNVEIGPILLSQLDQHHSHQAYLAIDDYDNSYVFWSDDVTGNSDIYYSALDMNGSVVIPATRLTSNNLTQQSHYMAGVFDSYNICIWSYYDENGTYVVYPIPLPETTIVPGLPRYGNFPTFVTSSTPFSFVVFDWAGNGIKGTYYHVDSSKWMNYTLSGPFIVSGEGAHSIFYNSTDMLHNNEPTKTFDLVVDDTPPTSSVITGEPNHTSGQTWITSLTPISIDAIDGGLIPVGLNYTKYRTWNGGSWTAWEDYSTPFTVGPAEGVSYVEVYSSDLLWNIETVANATYIVDNTPPLTQLQVGEPNYISGSIWVTSSTPLSLNPTDGGLIPVGVSRTSYRIWQGGSWDNWRDYSLPFTLSEEGPAYVEYYSIDLLNNAEEVHNETFMVDNSPPSPPTILDAYLGGNGLENVTISWSLSSDDENGSSNVIRYDIYRNSSYNSKGLGYELHDSLPNGTSQYVDFLAGEGNPSNYFYFVCAVNALNISSCTSNQAGKFTRSLAQGPNLVSVPLIQYDESIETVLQTVEYDKAWYYDSSSQEWKWYMTFKNYRRDLWSVNHTMGLWVNVTENSNLTVAGIVPAQTTIHLFEGWNLVSFPSFNTSYTVADLKVETCATRVEGYDFSSPYYLRVLGDGEVLQAGDGYWVRVNADTVWTIEVA